MSTLIGLKLNDTAILATDSRIYGNDQRNVLSDSSQKVFRVGRNLFFAWSGYTPVANKQAEMAAELSAEGTVRDIRAFADTLDLICVPIMLATINALAEIRATLPQYEAELSGEKPFAAYVLAGQHFGKPGFLAREFYYVGGQITHKEVDALNPLSRGEYRLYATRGESLADLVPNPKTWAHGPIAAVERFVERICEVEPLCGGKLQLAVIDQSGARWVHRPHADAARIEEQRAIGILNVGVQYAGTINANQVNSGGFTGRTLELDLNGTTVTIDNSYDTRLLGYPGLKVASSAHPDQRICVVDDGIWGMDLNNTVRFQLFTDGTLHLFDAGGVERVTLDGVNGQVLVNGMGVKVNGTSIAVP